jgi:MobA/MobL family
MAIYHYSLKTINRSTGRSSVAAAAYRSGEKLVDERTGNIYDYTRRDGVLHAEVFLPDGQTVGREELWNLAETAEKRKDAKVAREIVVALPHELDFLDQVSVVREYAQGLSRRTGWAVDIAVHAPGREGDQRNTHAHILCTTRKIERDETGQLVMGAKTRDWDVIATGKDLVMAERKEWERQVNRYLDIAQSKTRVDCRSYEAQGKTEQIPQIHLGVSACQMERKGIETERGKRNRDAAEHNRNIVDLKQKRDEREEVERWESLEQDKRRWSGMSVQDLKKELQTIWVSSARDLTFSDSEVKKAYQPLRSYAYYSSDSNSETQEAYHAGQFGWLDERQLEKREKAVEQASINLVWAKRYEQEWRDVHPYKAGLFDLGFPNQELGRLVRNRKIEEADEAKAKKALADFKKERRAAEKILEAAIQKVLPQAEVIYPHRKARQEALESILKPKQEQEWAQFWERDRARSQERGGRHIGF